MPNRQEIRLYASLLHETPFPESCHWKVAALWDYWSGIARALGRVPRRADIDPIDIPKLLANLWIVDFDPGTLRFRHRLIGTAVTRARNSDATGDFVDSEIPDLPQTKVGRELESVVRECRPVWSKAPPPASALPLHDVAEIERLSVPLAAESGEVEMVLSVSVFRMRTGDVL